MLNAQRYTNTRTPRRIDHEVVTGAAVKVGIHPVFVKLAAGAPLKLAPLLQRVLELLYLRVLELEVYVGEQNTCVCARGTEGGRKERREGRERVWRLCPPLFSVCACTLT